MTGMGKSGKLLLLAFASLSAAECQKTTLIPNTSPRHFVIFKGDHYSEEIGTPFGLKFSEVAGDTFEFQAKFDSSALYSRDAPDFVIPGVNKLLGFSDCNRPHTEFSARFGWRGDLDPSRIAIFPITHVDGQFHFPNQPLAMITPGQYYTYRISLQEAPGGNSQYLFEIIVDHQTYSLAMNRGCNGSAPLRYMSFPYFGGQSSAPHDVWIDLKYSL